MSGADTGATGVRTSEHDAATDEQTTISRDRPSVVEPLLVLIAEDEEPIAEALSFVVEDAGLTPLIAAHGGEALELARARHPALVITDLMMPQMDGTALIAALRADAQQDGHNPPPIILMTAAGMRRAEEAGADVVLRKPFNVDDLDAIIRRLLGL